MPLNVVPFTRSFTPGLVAPMPTLAVALVRFTLVPASVQPEDEDDELLMTTFLLAASNKTLVPPVPSKRNVSVFDPAENCVAPAALAHAPKAQAFYWTCVTVVRRLHRRHSK
jgi:hypothetical protein